MNNVERMFHYADVVQCSDGRLISPSGMGAVYELVDYLDHESGVTTLALIHLSDKVKKHLIARHPFLADPKIQQAVDKIVVELGDDPEASIVNLCETHLFPLMPRRYLPIPRFGEQSLVADDGKSYSEFLDRILKDKEVIVVKV